MDRITDWLSHTDICTMSSRTQKPLYIDQLKVIILLQNNVLNRIQLHIQDIIYVFVYKLKSFN